MRLKPLVSVHQQGMTLLELLVVMTILALISGLLMQGFSSALSIYERVQRRQAEGMPLELGYRWFAETLSGSQAELDPPRQFTGDLQQLSGVTHRPLIGNSGQASAFIWKLTSTSGGALQLTYNQPGQAQWLVGSWPAGSNGRFVYRSSKGAPIDHWPPNTEANQTNTDGTVPSAVLLEITPALGPPLRWYAHLPGRTYPRADYRDF